MHSLSPSKFMGALQANGTVTSSSCADSPSHLSSYHSEELQLLDIYTHCMKRNIAFLNCLTLYQTDLSPFEVS